MSLDVYLDGPEREEDCECDCGNRHKSKTRELFYSANITHNLAEMADKAGIYKALWRPEGLGITVAKDLIVLLEEGLSKLKADREFFQQFNAPNGWGLYADFVPFVENYLAALREYPEARVTVSR